MKIKRTLFFLKDMPWLPKRPGTGGWRVNKELVLKENETPHAWEKSSLAPCGWIDCGVVTEKRRMPFQHLTKKKKSRLQSAGGFFACAYACQLL